jgi:hypothetical protein
MAQYQPSYVDVSGFSKAISDAAYKAQQMAMKYDDYMNKSIDNQYKSYSGKLRKQDAAKFDAYFSDYSEAQKQFQRLNRGGRSSSEIRQANEIAQEKKRLMVDFVDRSTKYGQVQVGVGKLYKDGSKLLNKSKYNQVYSSLDMYDADELNNMYGAPEKVPTDFEAKKEDIDTKKYFGTIKGFSKIGNIANNKIEDYKVDPSTNQRITKSVSIPEIGEIEVPIKVVRIGMTPQEARNAVWASSKGEFEDAPAVYLKDINDGLASSNPVTQKQSKDILARAMATYGIADPTQVTGIDILAQSILDQSQQTIEVEDWSTLKTFESILAGRQRLSLSKQKLALAKKAYNDAKSQSSLRQGQSVINFMKSMVESGLVYDNDAKNFANGFLGKFGLEVNPAQAEAYKVTQGLNKVDISEEVATKKLGEKKKVPVKQP